MATQRWILERIHSERRVHAAINTAAVINEHVIMHDQQQTTRCEIQLNISADTCSEKPDSPPHQIFEHKPKQQQQTWPRTLDLLLVPAQHQVNINLNCNY